MSATVVSGDIPGRRAGWTSTRLGIRKSSAAPRNCSCRTCDSGSLACPTTSTSSHAACGRPRRSGSPSREPAGRSSSWEHSVLCARLELDRRAKMLSRIVHCLPVRPRLTVAVSEGVARDVREAFGARSSDRDLECRGCARGAAPSVGFGSATVEMLTMGAFRPHKNYVTALIVDEVPASALPAQPGRRWSAGTDASPDAQDLGVADRVRFLGRVGDVSQHLRTSDLLLHPSLFETFGFSLIEAADHGLPVVTLPVPAIDELVPRFVPGTMAGAPRPVLLRTPSPRRCCVGVRPPSSMPRHGSGGVSDSPPVAVAARWLEELAG